MRTTLKVTCLMESSVDGRLDESRWSLLYDCKGEGDPDVYYETKCQISPEISLLGKGTVLKHHCNKEFKADTLVVYSFKVSPGFLGITFS